MATPMVREGFESLTNLTVALRTVWHDQLTAINDEGASGILGLYNMDTSSRAQEVSQGIGGFADIPEYKGQLKFDSFEELYQKTYQHVEYAKGMAVERKLIDDDEYGVISGRASKLGLAFDRTIYKHSASVFNNAFGVTTAQATGGDTKALCAADHPYSPTDATTQSNTGTTALSTASLIATEALMMAFTDSRGENANIMPDTILVPVGLKHTAETIVGSNLKSGTANNDTNTLNGYRVIVSRALTDANNWFLIDSRQAMMSLNWYWRVRPEFTADPTSDFNLVSRFRGYMRYSFGFDNWNWIYGHAVS